MYPSCERPLSLYTGFCAEIVGHHHRVNDLFVGDISANDKLIYVDDVIKGRLLDCKILIQQAVNDVAAMRCYVASKLGEDVDVPDELKACMTPKITWDDPKFGPVNLVDGASGCSPSSWCSFASCAWGIYTTKLDTVSVGASIKKLTG